MTIDFKFLIITQYRQLRIKTRIEPCVRHFLVLGVLFRIFSTAFPSGVGCHAPSTNLRSLTLNLAILK